jgi:hypothetical protein
MPVLTATTGARFIDLDEREKKLSRIAKTIMDNETKFIIIPL